MGRPCLSEVVLTSWSVGVHTHVPGARVTAAPIEALHHFKLDVLYAPSPYRDMHILLPS